MKEAALVTGASSGIGDATVRGLLLAGYRVFAGVRRAVDATRIEQAGAEPVRLDVTDPVAISAAAAKIEKDLGEHRLAGLINNAGVPEAGPLEHLPLTRLRNVLEVNTVGVVAVTQAFLPLLRRCGGRVVNISSVSGTIALPFLGAYSASKFALEAISDAFRRELRGAGVEVIVIQPGSVRTAIWDRVRELDSTPFADSDYAGALTRFREAALERGARGLAADLVARAVVDALRARRPPTRVLVIRGSAMKLRILRLLPDRWLDWLIARRLD